MEVIEVPTRRGPARVHLYEAAGAPATLVLGHGAGGGVGARDLVAVREQAQSLGMTVAMVEQPYRVAGRRATPRAEVLDEAWLEVVAALRARGLGGRLICGGRSSGARVACRTSGAAGAAAVLCLAFPVHPPGRGDDPTKSRLSELEAVAVPVLVVQGERDPFGIPPPRPGRQVVRVPGDHSLRNVAAVAEVVAAWLGPFATG